MHLLRLIIEVALILLKWYYDPDRARQAIDRRLEREREERREKFREALAKKDPDTASDMLASVRDRLRRKNRVPDGK